LQLSVIVLLLILKDRHCSARVLDTASVQNMVSCFCCMTVFRNVCPLLMGKLTRMSDYGNIYIGNTMDKWTALNG